MRTVETFQRVGPSVAFIQTQMVKPESHLNLRPMEIPAGTGSGFLWDDKGRQHVEATGPEAPVGLGCVARSPSFHGPGHVVTNYHVVFGGKAPPSSVKVLLRGKSEAFDAKLVGSEAEKDLAVLRISTGNLPPPLELSSSAELCVGVAHVSSAWGRWARKPVDPPWGHTACRGCAQARAFSQSEIRSV